MSRRAAVGTCWLAVAYLIGGCSSPGLALKRVAPPSFSADAKWSAHASYLQAMITQIDRRWEKLLVDTRPLPPAGTAVKVVFRLSATGAITSIVSVDGDAGWAGEKACVTAIAHGSPYPPWTDAMKSELGEAQELTFTFNYQ